MGKELPPLVIGIAGFGTVGSGLLRILTGNSDHLEARTGRKIKVKTILVRDAKKKRAVPLPKAIKLTTKADDLLKDKDIELVVELMGGVDAAKTFIEGALKAGKHVVTANKALLAETGNQLFALAEKKGLHLEYEASICGGIPIVETLKNGLAANRIQTLVGILNGTCNYILSEMTTRGLAFKDVLKTAQELGYAEADPTLDIEGFDAAHKLSLLIRLAWGQEYPYSKMPVQGVTGVTAEDIAYAREFGYRIKLIGQARMEGGKIEAGVFPALIHETYLMARVGGAYNAVRVEGDAVGPIFLHGKGAGDMPTGSAVAADIVTVARGLSPCNTGYVKPSLPVKAAVVNPKDAHSNYYIRLLVTDKPGVMRDVAGILTENNISIAQAIQKGGDKTRTVKGKPAVPFIVMTHDATALGIQKAMAKLSKAGYVHEPPVYFRVLTNAH